MSFPSCSISSLCLCYIRKFISVLYCYRGLCLRSSCDPLYASQTVVLSFLSLLLASILAIVYDGLIFLYNSRQLVPSLHFRFFGSALLCVQLSLFPQQETYTQKIDHHIISSLQIHMLHIAVVFVCYSFRLFACKFVLQSLFGWLHCTILSHYFIVLELVPKNVNRLYSYCQYNFFL